MYCKKCDWHLEENATVCPNCGKKVSSSKNSNITIFVLLIVGIITVAGIAIGLNIMDKNKKERLNNQEVEITKLGIANNVTFVNYTFALPEFLQYSYQENYLYGSTNDKSISFKMNVVEASYEQITDKYEDFLKAIIKSGTEIISYNVMAYQDVEYFLISIMKNSKEYLYAATELDSSHIVQFILESVNIEGYEVGINYMNQITGNYEKLNTDVNMECTGTLNDFLLGNKASAEADIKELFKPKTNE